MKCLVKNCPENDPISEEREWLCPRCFVMIVSGHVTEEGTTFIHQLRNDLRDLELEMLVVARMVETMIEENADDADQYAEAERNGS